jgi:uncharacterized protein
VTHSSVTHAPEAGGVVARLAAARREVVLFLVGTGVVGLHVVDDSFIQPQPGTSAGDHLAGGLVPLALLALAAAVYPRVRAGLRASIALTLGIFGIVVGIEGWYYTLEASPSGDDYTGLVAIPAGLLLLGTGAATLWRTRRRDDSLRRRYVRRLLLAVGGFLTFYVILFQFASAYVITHTARAYVPTPELGAAYEDVAFTTSDGLRLEGWYVPSKNGATVIVFPGRKGPQKPASVLVRHDYGVLLFDRRGEGESEGDPNALGWAGTRDLKAAISFLQARPEVDDERIGGLGLSVGGEMLLQAATETDELKAVVSEGAGIRSVREAVHLSGSERWIQAPVTALLTAGTAIFGNDMPPRGLTDLSAEISVPVFFIYATPGQGGESLTTQYHDAAKQPKEIWAAEGGHTGAIDAEPEEYERRVVSFFDRALLDSN